MLRARSSSQVPLALGVPIEPVWRGEIQGPGLGMDVDDDDPRPSKREDVDPTQKRLQFWSR